MKKELYRLTAITPIDGRYRKKVSDFTEIFSEHGLQKRRTFAEIKWLLFLANLLDIFIEKEEIRGIHAIADKYSIYDSREIKDIEKKTNHDVKSVEYYIKDRLDDLNLSSLKELVHFGLTSEDITNIAIALMVKDGLGVILKELSELLNTLEGMAQVYWRMPMVSHTHGQPASPTTVGKEFVVFAHMLRKEINILRKIQIEAKLNGASGNYSALDAALPEIAWINAGECFIRSIGFRCNLFTVQTNSYNYLAQIMHCLARLSAIIINLDRDMWEYISRHYFVQKPKEGEVGSSTMPHKVNPIDFENSEGNLEYVIPIMDNFAAKLLITRMQRDLTDSTFLRNLGSVFSHFLIAIKSTIKGLDKASVDEKTINRDLAKNQELLAEPIQTIMRMRNESNPYERLKELTRGKKVVRKDLVELVNNCIKLKPEDKKWLKNLSPKKYIGLAPELVEKYFTEYRI